MTDEFKEGDNVPRETKSGELLSEVQVGDFVYIYDLKITFTSRKSMVGINYVTKDLTLTPIESEEESIKTIFRFVGEHVDAINSGIDKLCRMREELECST